MSDDELNQYYAFVLEELGGKTAKRWFGEYVTHYTKKKLLQLQLKALASPKAPR